MRQESKPKVVLQETREIGTQMASSKQEERMTTESRSRVRKLSRIFLSNILNSRFYQPRFHKF